MFAWAPAEFAWPPALPNCGCRDIVLPAAVNCTAELRLPNCGSWSFRHLATVFVGTARRQFLSDGVSLLADLLDFASPVITVRHERREISASCADLRDTAATAHLLIACMDSTLRTVATALLRTSSAGPARVCFHPKCSKNVRAVPIPWRNRKFRSSRGRRAPHVGPPPHVEQSPPRAPDDVPAVHSVVGCSFFKTFFTTFVNFPPRDRRRCGCL